MKNKWANIIVLACIFAAIGAGIAQGFPEAVDAVAVCLGLR
jgi:hypothetical protein